MLALDEYDPVVVSGAIEDLVGDLAEFELGGMHRRCDLPTVLAAADLRELELVARQSHLEIAPQSVIIRTVFASESVGIVSTISSPARTSRSMRSPKISSLPENYW